MNYSGTPDMMIILNPDHPEKYQSFNPAGSE